MADDTPTVDPVMREIARRGGRFLVLAELDARNGHSLTARECAREFGTTEDPATIAQGFLTAVLADDYIHNSPREAVESYERTHGDEADAIMATLDR